MQKKKIGCLPNITEKEYCETMGYYIVWDCGKIRWEYKGDVERRVRSINPPALFFC